MKYKYKICDIVYDFIYEDIYSPITEVKFLRNDGKTIFIGTFFNDNYFEIYRSESGSAVKNKINILNTDPEMNPRLYKKYGKEDDSEFVATGSDDNFLSASLEKTEEYALYYYVFTLNFSNRRSKADIGKDFDEVHIQEPR